MKKSLLHFTLIVLLLLPIAYLQAQSFTDAGSYMSFIGNHHREITKDFMSYTSAVAHGKSARKVENRRKEMMQSMTEARRKIGTMGPFQGDKSLRDSTAKYLLTSYHVLNDDYGKIVNLEEVAEQSYDGMEAYLLAQDLAHEKLDQARERLELVEKSFAAKHNIRMIEKEDELSEKVNKVAKVNSYHRLVFLIFFKSYKQEIYLMEAIQQKNINSIEQNNNTLQNYAQEGLAKLDTMAAFSGDRSIVTACKQLLEFYKMESKDKIPVYTNYYLKEENFTKIKKAFDAKREKDRTQEDVNQYNKAIDEMNKAGNEFNNTNKELNDQRKKILDSWNKSADNFLDKHTPKYK